MSDLTLQDLHPSGWYVQVRGQVYGPYDDVQIAEYRAEGRLLSTTLVSEGPMGPWRPAGRLGQPRPQPEVQTEPLANLMIYSDLPAGYARPFEEELSTFGACAYIAPGLWLLRTPQSAAVLRNALSKTLRPGDRFVIVDATRDKIAWFNMGFEADIRIRDLWSS